MRNKKKYLLILAVSLLLLTPILGSLPASAQTGTKPETIVFITEPNASEGITKLEDGDLDIYAYTIADSALLARIEASPELDYYRSYGSYNELTFNPAGPVFNNGKLNPFASPRVREAMNILIDRDHIVNNIFGGLATSRWTSLNSASLDAALLGSEVRTLELNYAYNKNLAKQIIDGEMLALGAVLNAGKWTYGGEPVEISVLIRIEDSRLQIGNYVADQLEDIGFTVIRDEKSAADASPIWYRGDPAEGLFHIYTGGWISTAIPRDLSNNFAFFYTDMGFPSPLWQAYVNTPEFYALAQRLESGDYTTLEERHAMMARALELSLEDSVRIFLLDNNAFTPKRVDVSLAADLYGGVAGAMLWAKSIQSTQAGDSTVTIAIPTMLHGPWNPIAGTNWVYDMMPIRGTADFGVVSDPYTGISLPDRIERAEVVVQEGLIVQKTHDWVDLSFQPEIVVPEDAWGAWDAETQRFIRVDELSPGEPITALRKSTVYYPEDLYDTVKWHDGSPFSIADIFMNMILTFDRGQKASLIYDESAVSAYNTLMSVFKGVRITSVDPLIIETYTDSFNRDAELSVSTWWPYYAQGQGAWHALTLGIRLETAGKAAFSTAKAETNQVPWLSYVIRNDDVIAAQTFSDELTAWNGDKLIPYAPTLTTYLEEGELDSRLANLQTWFNKYGHLWIGTGPYYLEAANHNLGTLTLQQFPEHPDPADRWTEFADSPIPTVQIIGPDSIELGGEAVYDIFVTQGTQATTGQLSLQGIGLRSGEPYPSEDIERVDYLLVGQNKVYLSGQAAFVEEGHYQVVVDKDTVSMLPGGAIQLEVVVVSKRVAITSTSGVGIDNQNYKIFLPLSLR